MVCCLCFRKTCHRPSATCGPCCVLSDRVILCFVSDLFPSLIRIVEAYLCVLARVPSTAPSTPAVIIQPPLEPHPQGQGALGLPVFYG